MGMWIGETAIPRIIGKAGPLPRVGNGGGEVENLQKGGNAKGLASSEYRFGRHLSGKYRKENPKGKK